MLTTRGETYGDETIEATDGWRFPRNETGFSPDEELLTVPAQWLATPGPLEIERSNWWRWRRRAAMVASISGIALAVVTFSLGSPVSNYALTSADEPTVETDTGSSTGAADLDIDLAHESQPVSLFALSANTAEAFHIKSGLGVGGGSLNLSGTVETTTTTVATTTTIGWSEPVIEPEANWTDAGNGVAVPDVLLRIRFCESTNNYQAANRSSSARGAYQFLSSSWSWYGHAARYGAASADLATPAQQDEAAVLTLKQDGTRPWRESFTCWGSESINPDYATVKAPATTTTAPTTTASSADETTTSATDPSTTSTTTQSSTSTSAPQPSSSTTSSTAPTTTASTTSTTAAGG